MTIKRDSEKTLSKYRNLLHDVFNTRIYQYLKEKYISNRFEIVHDENGNPIRNEKGHIISKGTLFQTNLPDTEGLSYALSLLRQFLLEKDEVSIYNIGKNIKEIGGEEKYQDYLNIMEKFNSIMNTFTGAHFNVEKENGTVISKHFTKIELIRELYYGDMIHRDEDKVPIFDILSMNKIVTCFLEFLIYICRIAHIIPIKEEEIFIYCENCPEKILSGNCKGMRQGYKKV